MKSPMPRHDYFAISLERVRACTVAIIGYGNQGAAHAQNLRDSGVSVIIGAREHSRTGQLAADVGFSVLGVREAAKQADVIMLMAPDEKQAEIYTADIAPVIRAQQTLGFCHGFNIHFGYTTPLNDVDVILVSPKVPGYVLRENYTAKRGSLCLVGVAQNATGGGKDLALSYAAAISGGDAGILETTFEDECVTNLFGEQAVLCGGVPEVMKAGFDTLLNAGYPAELAWSECIMQTKLLVDLIHRGGIKFMREKISDTAEYGGLTAGPRIINAAVRTEMAELLQDIQSGKFAKTWMAESVGGNVEFNRLRAAEAAHASEAVSKRMRGLAAQDA